jgi:hypothetical protein
VPDDALLAGPAAAPAAYRLELRRAGAPEPAAPALGHGGDVAALLAAAEGHAAALIARGEAGVLCVVAAATGRTVARRPAWPVGGPRPGIEADAWWGAGGEPGAAH